MSINLKNIKKEIFAFSETKEKKNFSVEYSL